MWQQTVNLCESKLGSIPNRGAKFCGKESKRSMGTSKGV